MNVTAIARIDKPQPDLLTETIQSKLANPERSSNFDLHGALKDVLMDVSCCCSGNGQPE